MLLDSSLLKGIALTLQATKLSRFRAIATLKEKEGWPEKNHAYGHLRAIIISRLLQAALQLVCTARNAGEFSPDLAAVIALILQRGNVSGGNLGWSRSAAC